jgi:hypothetical protein
VGLADYAGKPPSLVIPNERSEGGISLWLLLFGVPHSEIPRWRSE